MRLLFRLLVLFVVAAGCGSGSDNTTTSTGSGTRASSTEETPSSRLSPIAPSATSIQARLLAASDLGPGFVDGRDQVGFMIDTAKPTPCGQPNVNTQVPPSIDVGWVGQEPGILYVQEEVLVYGDAATAAQAFEKIKTGSSCAQATVSVVAPFSALSSACAQFTRQDRCTFMLTSVQDFSTRLGADAAIATVPFQDLSLHGQLLTIRDDTSIITFQFASSSPLPDVLAIVEQGLAKLTN